MSAWPPVAIRTGLPLRNGSESIGRRHGVNCLRHGPSTRERPRFRGDNNYGQRKRPAPSEFVERNAGACSLRATPKPAPPSRRPRSYLRDAEAYMLISMPTCISTIFGVFQVIGGSPWSAARLPRSCMHHVASYCRLPSKFGFSVARRRRTRRKHCERAGRQ